MWKVAGKKIFPRWQRVRQTASKCRNVKTKEAKPGTLCVVADRKSQSNGHDWKQHARHHQWVKDDPQFQNYALCNSLLETVGLVGTAAFCLDLQHRHCRIPCRDGCKNGCVFSRLAYAMPWNKNKPKSLETSSTSKNKAECSVKPFDSKSESKIDKITEELNNFTNESIAAMENSIGLMFLKQDDKQAFDFFKASAQLGCPKGLFNLGLCYETGRGTKVNFSKAARCYEKAAAKGHGFAIYNLAVYTLKGLGGIPKDFDKGMKLLEEAAEKDVPEAQFSLGVHCLEVGKYNEAYRMFRACAETDNIDGKYYLGLCYENGWGVPQNETVAAELYAAAARKGHEDATLRLGLCFETGNGLDPDTEFSMTLYKMLADKGHMGGKRAMQALKEKQEAKWRIRSHRDKQQDLQLNSNKGASALHTSASVPELRSYSSQCKIEHSKAVLHSVTSLQDCFISEAHEAQETSKSLKYSLDLAVTGAVPFQLAMPHTLVANS